jgi:uncharacterized membrane protein YidH (DUF202 family)
MVLGLYFHSNAITAFKVIPEQYSRVYHITLHLISTFCLALAFYVSWTFVDVQEISKHRKGHLISTHAWLGLITLICYFLQFVFGFSVFVVFQYLTSKYVFLADIKAWFFNKHKFFGLACYLMAILSLITGIEERQNIYHYFQLKHPLPASSYMFANFLVISFLSLFGCVMYILFYTKQDQLHEENSYDPVGNVY